MSEKKKKDAPRKARVVLPAIKASRAVGFVSTAQRLAEFSSLQVELPSRRWLEMAAGTSGTSQS
jgi:hypothetical protein